MDDGVQAYEMITSSGALIIYSVIMCTAFGVSIAFPAAPFLAFSAQLTIGFAAYITKRIIQKKKEYNGNT